MSSMPGTGITFDILGGAGGLDRTLSDALSRIKSFAADVNRIKAQVDVGVSQGSGAGTLAASGRRRAAYPTPDSPAAAPAATAAGSRAHWVRARWRGPRVRWAGPGPRRPAAAPG
jgi:hypothetical protein